MGRELNFGCYSYSGIDVFYRPGTEDEKVLAHSFQSDVFFKEIPSFAPGRNPIVIDIGAHIGTFSILAAIKYPGARIYAYEPCYDTFQVLNKNVKYNKIESIHISQSAVAAVAGIAKLYHSHLDGNWGHTITKEVSPSFEEVKSVTLEAIIEDERIDFIDLLKLNCEGAEFGILTNTPDRVIQKIGVGIILYHEDLDTRNGDVKQLVRLFERLGFRIVLSRREEKRGWLVVWNKRRYSWTYFLQKALARRLKAWS